MSEDTFKDPVRVQTVDLATGETTIHKHIYEREMLEKWILHQKENASTDVIDWGDY